MNKIHPLATVSPDARLGDNIEIGPYAFIDANVEIGDGCKILPHAVIFSYVKMGRDCTVSPVRSSAPCRRTSSTRARSPMWRSVTA